MTILLVDDNAQMRRLLRSLIEELAEAVYECDDGAAVLAAYQAHQPDWVLMDFKMKQVDGLTATRQIIDAFPEARIVFVTNYDDAQLREAARQAGAIQFIAKEDLSRLRLILSPRAGNC